MIACDARQFLELPQWKPSLARGRGSQWQGFAKPLRTAGSVAIMAAALALGSSDAIAQTAGAASPPASAPAAAAPVATSFDRIIVSGNGSSLTGTNGGGGGSLSWLHNFSPDSLIGVGAEHQVLSVSHWTFGSLTASRTLGSGNQRYTIYGTAHEGAGDDGGKPFKYRIETLGLTGTYFHRLSATLEDQQVNVETTHGNMPKVGLAYLWNPHVQTSLAYQYSFGGNLGTHLTSGRLDLYGPVNFLGGFAVGQASPSVLNHPTTLPPHDLKEGYVGLSKSFAGSRSELALIADYQHLSGGLASVLGVPSLVPPSTRWTGTLTYTVRLNGR
ncbi:MAG TPA: hypothetical protein VN750_28330 [Steroidobacteraceae bacterium]|nr:hypothetical protein [Steroidobacteraceae bacterium]